MRVCDLFTMHPDFRPYTAVGASELRAGDPAWGRLTAAIDFGAPDAEEISLRHAILESEGIPRRE